MAVQGNQVGGVMPKSSVNYPETPTAVIVIRGHEPHARYVFDRGMSLLNFFLRICSDDREYMLNAALRYADKPLYDDRSGYAIKTLLNGRARPERHAVGDTDEHFVIFYK